MNKKPYYINYLVSLTQTERNTNVKHLPQELGKCSKHENLETLLINISIQQVRSKLLILLPKFSVLW